MMKIPMFMFAALLLITVCILPVSAASVSDAGFSINAVIPDNQIDASKTYFDLKMEPGQKQDLVVQVVNPNSWDIDVTVEAISASTNLNGIINYTTESELRDESLRYAFADIAEVSDKQITVSAHQSVDVTITVTMPEESYDGMILGAIRAIKLPTEEEKNSGAMIINQYSYVTGVRLRETDTVLAQDFALGLVGPELINYRAAVTAQIRNIIPEIATKVSVEGKLFIKGEEEPLIERKQPDVEMAPNSIYPFAFVDEAGYGFDPGDYYAQFTVTQGDRTWSFEQEFAIAADQANEVNNSALNQQQNAPTALRRGSIPLWVWILSGIGIVILVALLLVVLRVRRNNKAYERYMQSVQSEIHT